MRHTVIHQSKGSDLRLYLWLLEHRIGCHVRRLSLLVDDFRDLARLSYFEYIYLLIINPAGCLGSRVVSVLDSGAEGPGFKSQSRRCRVTVLGKLFTLIMSLFTEQQNW